MQLPSSRSTAFSPPSGSQDNEAGACLRPGPSSSDQTTAACNPETEDSDSILGRYPWGVIP